MTTDKGGSVFRKPLQGLCGITSHDIKYFGRKRYRGTVSRCVCGEEVRKKNTCYAAKRRVPVTGSIPEVSVITRLYTLIFALRIPFSFQRHRFVAAAATA